MTNEVLYVSGQYWSVSLQSFQFEQNVIVYIVTHCMNKNKKSELYYFASTAEKAFRKWVTLYASVHTEKTIPHEV